MLFASAMQRTSFSAFKCPAARALETEPRLLLLDEPTRGVDAGAKQEICGFIEEFVEQGNGVIMVSSEVDEVLGRRRGS